MERIESEVVIAGGGLVGLTLAVALAGAGVTVTVVEREAVKRLAQPAFDGRASAIAAGSAEILATLGLWRGMAAAAEPILEIRVTDGESPLFLHYDFRDAGTGALGHMVENRAIRKVLLARIAGQTAARMVDGRSVVGLMRDGAGVRLGLDDGATIRARLAVAADGRDSPLRRAAGIAATAWRYPQTGIVCTVEHQRPHRGIAQEHFLAAGPFAILPMTGRRSSIVWTEREALAPRILGLSDAAFADELGRRFGDHLGALSVVGPRFASPLGLGHAASYFADRVALIGDAAHGMHPIAGQGFNMGLRDVAALAELVVDACRLGLDPGTATTLARYQRRRRLDNLLMLAITDSLNRLFCTDLGPVRLARGAGLAAINRMPAIKRLLMRHAMGLAGELPRLTRGLPL